MSISNEIITVLDELAKRFGVAVDWTATNVIPYIEQLCDKYIRYEIATSIAWVVIALIPFIIVISLFIYLGKHKDVGVYKGYYEDDYEIRIGLYCAICVLGIIPLCIIVRQAFDITTCLTFPEKIIYDALNMMSK